MLTKKLISYRTKAFVKKNNAIRSSTGYRKTKKTGILLTIEDREKHETIKGFIKKLKKDGKQVEVMAYLPRNRDNYEFMYDFFTGDDISVWGTITSDKVNEFMQKPFDYLFYMDGRSHVFLRSILAMSKAKCRIAPYDKDNMPYCEMMLRIPDKKNNVQLAETMYHYTRVLS